MMIIQVQFGRKVSSKYGYSYACFGDLFFFQGYQRGNFWSNSWLSTVWKFYPSLSFRNSYRFLLFSHRHSLSPLKKGDAKDSIAVRLLSWPTPEQFAEKIHDADLIEGSAYERKIEEVLIEGDIRKQAYVYISKTNTLDGEWTHIPSGDWLQRVFK